MKGAGLIAGLLVAVLYFCTFQSINGDASGCCPDGWVPNDGACFLFYTYGTKTWPEAKDFCREWGSELVTIKSSQHQDFIWQQIKYMVSSSQKRKFWIGLNDRKSEDVWEWTDGSKDEYRLWQTGQPNDISGDQDCAELGTYDMDGTWNDSKCENKNWFICKRSVYSWPWWMPKPSEMANSK
uniref:Toxin candidate TRINITY_DN18450_c0_g1_i1.p1 n=1 Tax=Pachycerianthus borealis TaxID=2736680 RepID=A0A7G7WYU6_9CNID|nr:toxin candidate TRINITY_DN18450_c0_g1_i1.p1 [Pachycerianthus borealis]